MYCNCNEKQFAESATQNGKAADARKCIGQFLRVLKLALLTSSCVRSRVDILLLVRLNSSGSRVSDIESMDKLCRDPFNELAQLFNVGSVAAAIRSSPFNVKYYPEQLGVFPTKHNSDCNPLFPGLL